MYIPWQQHLQHIQVQEHAQQVVAAELSGIYTNRYYQCNVQQRRISFQNATHGVIAALLGIRLHARPSFAAACMIFVTIAALRRC